MEASKVNLIKELNEITYDDKILKDAINSSYININRLIEDCSFKNEEDFNSFKKTFTELLSFSHQLGFEKGKERAITTVMQSKQL